MTKTQLQKLTETIKRIVKEELKNEQFFINPEYTHFALEKSTNKIVFGWDFLGMMRFEIQESAKMDLKDMFPDRKLSEFRIVGLKKLKSEGINPFDYKSSWKLDK